MANIFVKYHPAAHLPRCHFLLVGGIGGPTLHGVHKKVAVDPFPCFFLRFLRLWNIQAIDRYHFMIVVFCHQELAGTITNGTLPYRIAFAIGGAFVPLSKGGLRLPTVTPQMPLLDFWRRNLVQ